jgi:hypothetical protein
MADELNAPSPRRDATVSERVQELTWALVENEIDEDELRLLDNLLLSDEAARDTYVDCVQLHTDLLVHFSEAEKQPPVGGQSPVLGFLAGDVPPMDVQPTQS